MTLHLAAGASLHASEASADDESGPHGNAPVIAARGCTNVAIAGRGTVDNDRRVPNNDGNLPDCSLGVRISDCLIDTARQVVHNDAADAERAVEATGATFAERTE